MSNKKNIDSIVDIISKEAHILTRDLIELERLQSAEALVAEKFALASYRKFAERIIQKINALIPAYKIILPSSILGSYKGSSCLIPVDQIIQNSYQSLGDANVGTFIISPIDGLINFTRSIPMFCFGLTVVINEDDKMIPHQSFVYEVTQNKFYTATNKNGSFLNGTKLLSSERSKIHSASVIINGLENLIKERNKDTDVVKFATKIKNLSISCASHISGVPSQLGACYLASGKADIVVEANLYDSANLIAGVLVAKEAGCFIFDINGSELTIEDILQNKTRSVIITNRKIADEVVKLLKSQII